MIAPELAGLHYGTDEPPLAPEREPRARPALRHRFELAVPGAIAKGVPPDCTALIEAAYKRPELRPLSSAVSFAVDARMTMPFRARAGCEVVLNPRSLANPALCAVHLRHALELALLQRELALAERSPWHRAAAALLACRAAAIYFDSLVFLEQELARPHLPGWLCRAFEHCRAPLLELPIRLDAALPAQAMVIELLALQGEAPQEAPADPAQREDAQRWLREMLPLAAPTEVVIASGGDSRSRLDARTGLNNYGCCPRPRPWAVTFASSTATSISDLAYQRAEARRATLLAAAAHAPLGDTYAGLVEDVRERLAHALRLPDGNDIVLSSSGTDAEFYALYLADCDVRKRVVNVIVAPDETGSGVLAAAAGRHFSDITPRGGAVRHGSPVQGFDPARVEVQSVAVRDVRGELLPVAAVDARVEEVVEAAVAVGARVLLHVVDAAKTGLGAPGLRCVEALCERHAGTLDVVVDACQLRVDPDEIRAYLQRGWMLLLTGSKFFTGPPFSGALVVPPTVAARVRRLPPPPPGLGAYCGRCDWPSSWTTPRAAFDDWHNFGLLLRWEAALWEMEAFFSVEPREREQTLRTFLRRLRAAIERCKVTQLQDTPAFDRTLLGVATSPFAQQTILTFTVQRTDGDGGARPLTVEEAQAVYQWLNVDISHQLPLTASEAELTLARRRFHIGQPVKLARCGSSWVGGLRISAGARLVSGVAHDPALGPTREVRLTREIEDAEMILDKIALIVRHFDSLSRGILPPAVDVGRLYEV